MAPPRLGIQIGRGRVETKGYFTQLLEKRSNGRGERGGVRRLMCHHAHEGKTKEHQKTKGKEREGVQGRGSERGTDNHLSSTKKEGNENGEVREKEMGKEWVEAHRIFESSRRESFERDWYPTAPT